MELESIIAQIQKGQAKYERELFDQTTDQLMAVALRYVFDEQAACDVLQEAYIRIFSSIHSFRYQSEAETWSWLQKIVVHEALRWIKKNERWSKLRSRASKTESLSSVNHLLRDDKIEMLKCLRKEERLVFNMYAIEGYSHKEIAHILGLAVSSSRSLLTRARKKLRQQLETMERRVILPNQDL
jgi:RNA polymerase sigma-70 factor (ECF subfamily)